MKKITSDIVAKLWNLCNILKDDGVTYHQYVTELTYLLFLKMAKETGAEDQLPADHRWADLEARTAPQRDWLKRIAAQTTANLLVDREALDDPDLVFKREGGGFTRLDKIFNGQLQQVLEAFNDSMWWQDARPTA